MDQSLPSQQVINFISPNCPSLLQITYLFIFFFHRGVLYHHRSANTYLKPYSEQLPNNFRLYVLSTCF